MHADLSDCTSGKVFASISQRLDEIDATRRLLNEEELFLKERWNSFAPINKLPHEILIDVLILYDDEDINPWLPRDVAWLRIVSTCRHWYRVACATPLLWRTIQVSRRNFAWVELCLNRSMTAPLRISLRSPSDELLESIALHSHRIQHLNAIDPWTTQPLSFLHSPMPLLEKLRLFGGVNMSNTGFFGFETTPGNYPLLRDLELISTKSMPKNLAFYSNLRRLSLRSCTIDINLDHFYDILAACTRLESLALYHFLSYLRPPDGSQRSRSAPWRSLIPFPHMTELSLSQEHHDDISLFLAHLLLPQAMTGLSIFAVVLKNEHEARLTATLPADRTNLLPVLSTVAYVELNMWDDKYTMHASTDADIHTATVALTLTAYNITCWDHFLQSRGLRDLLDIFRYARLTGLWIAGNFDTITCEDEWKTVFTAFSGLEKLECYAEGKSTPYMWPALHIAQSTEQVICPRLHTIGLFGCRLRGAEKAKLFFENAIACLRSRAARRNALQRLDLQVASKGDQASAAMERKYLATVQQFVREVQLRFYH